MEIEDKKSKKKGAKKSQKQLVQKKEQEQEQNNDLKDNENNKDNSNDQIEQENQQKQELDQNNLKNKKTSKKTIKREVEVIYVPVDYHIFMTQFPLRSKYQTEFEDFLQPISCQYKAKQKKININYAHTDKFTNVKDDLRNQTTNEFNSQVDNNNSKYLSMEGGMETEADSRKLKMEAQLKAQQEELMAGKQSVTYTSKQVLNKTNYFASHLDKQNNKLYLFPVESFQQMRPVIKQQKSALQSKSKTSQEIKKISREIERDKNLLQKHPEKYAESRLKNFTTFQEIYNSEEFKTLRYKDLTKNNNKDKDRQQSHSSSARLQQNNNNNQNPLLRFPQEIVNLDSTSKDQYINLLEGNK